MKKILLMALLLTMFLGMHSQTGMRMLITYFSWHKRTSFGKTYSVIGMVSDCHGIVIQNGKKYINSKK